MTADLTVPYAFPAERAVLGAIFRDPRAVDSVAEWLRPDHFGLERHGLIYGAMLAAHGKRNPPDRIFVAAELRAAGQLSDVGGEIALIDVMAEVPHAAHIEQHARLVEHTAILRRIIEAGGQVAALGFDQARPLEDVAADVEKAIGQALAGRTQREKAHTLRSVMDTLLVRVQERGDRGGVVGLPTGYPDLDQFTGGLQPSDLIILAARPGMGKTSLALSLAYNVALLADRDGAYLPGLPVGVFSLEMSRDQLGQRLLSMHTGIDMQRVRTGDLRADELDRTIAAMGDLSEAPILIEDTPGLTIRDLQRRARRMHTAQPLGLLIVDYLQLMAGSGSKDGRVQEVSEISRGLKALARELDIPVIALSQLSRAVEGRQSKVPQLSDLRESGAIEQDADIVMFIYREEVYDKDTDKKGLAELHIAKHRNGPLGTVPLRFSACTTRFEHLQRYSAVPGYDEY